MDIDGSSIYCDVDVECPLGWIVSMYVLEEEGGEMEGMCSFLEEWKKYNFWDG